MKLHKGTIALIVSALLLCPMALSHCGINAHAKSYSQKVIRVSNNVPSVHGDSAWLDRNNKMNKTMQVNNKQYNTVINHTSYNIQKDTFNQSHEYELRHYQHIIQTGFNLDRLLATHHGHVYRAPISNTANIANYIYQGNYADVFNNSYYSVANNRVKKYETPKMSMWRINMNVPTSHGLAHRYAYVMASNYESALVAHQIVSDYKAGKEFHKKAKNFVSFVNVVDYGDYAKLVHSALTIGKTLHKNILQNIINDTATLGVESMGDHAIGLNHHLIIEIDTAGRNTPYGNRYRYHLGFTMFPMTRKEREDLIKTLHIKHDKFPSYSKWLSIMYHSKHHSNNKVTHRKYHKSHKTRKSYSHHKKHAHIYINMTSHNRHTLKKATKKAKNNSKPYKVSNDAEYKLGEHEAYEFHDGDIDNTVYHYGNNFNHMLNDSHINNRDWVHGYVDYLTHNDDGYTKSSAVNTLIGLLDYHMGDSTFKQGWRDEVTSDGSAINIDKRPNKDYLDGWTTGYAMFTYARDDANESSDEALSNARHEAYTVED